MASSFLRDIYIPLYERRGTIMLFNNKAQKQLAEQHKSLVNSVKEMLDIIEKQQKAIDDLHYICRSLIDQINKESK